MTWAIVALISIVGGTLSIRTERRYRALQRKLEERREVRVEFHPVNVAARGSRDELAAALAERFRRASGRPHQREVE